MFATIYGFIDQYYLPVYLVMLLVLIGVFALAFKKRSDFALVLGLVLAVSFVLLLYFNPDSFFTFDIARTLVTLGAMAIFGGIAFFAIIARAFWMEDMPRTTLWRVFLLVLTILGAASLVIYVFNK